MILDEHFSLFDIFSFLYRHSFVFIHTQNIDQIEEKKSGENFVIKIKRTFYKDFNSDRYKDEIHVNCIYLIMLHEM